MKKEAFGQNLALPSLFDLLKKERVALFKKRLALSFGQTKKPHEIRASRRKIAQLLTLIRHKAEAGQ